MSTKLRVIQYNLLSNNLCTERNYPETNGYLKTHVDSDTRYRLIERRLKDEIARNDAIICLQEVSMSWVGKLVQFFDDANYTFVYRLYGSGFNGYMGVGIAYPRYKYDLITSKVMMPADEFQFDRAPKVLAPAWWLRFVLPYTLPWLLVLLNAYYHYVPNHYALPVLALLLPLFVYFSEEKFKHTPYDVFAEAKKRWNALVFVRLRDVDTGKLFCVGTYHMPCAFRYPQMMTLHAKLAALCLWREANGDALIFAGDFNFKPHEAMYRLYVDGELDESDPAYPVPPLYTQEPTSAEARAKHAAFAELPDDFYFNSAYAVVNGVEPEFTNYAQSERDKEPFSGTLDYIFLTEQCVPKEVLQLPSKLPKNLMPNASEPSDHLMLAATIQL